MAVRPSRLKLAPVRVPERGVRDLLRLEDAARRAVTQAEIGLPGAPSTVEAALRSAVRYRVAAALPPTPDSELFIATLDRWLGRQDVPAAAIAALAESLKPTLEGNDANQW